jgi:hypothetical protein
MIETLALIVSTAVAVYTVYDKRRQSRPDVAVAAEWGAQYVYATVHTNIPVTMINAGYQPMGALGGLRRHRASVHAQHKNPEGDGSGFAVHVEQAPLPQLVSAGGTHDLVIGPSYEPEGWRHRRGWLPGHGERLRVWVRLSTGQVVVSPPFEGLPTCCGLTEAIRWNEDRSWAEQPEAIH